MPSNMPMIDRVLAALASSSGIVSKLKSYATAMKDMSIQEFIRWLTQEENKRNAEIKKLKEKKQKNKGKGTKKEQFNKILKQKKTGKSSSKVKSKSAGSKAKSKTTIKSSSAKTVKIKSKTKQAKIKSTMFSTQKKTNEQKKKSLSKSEFLLKSTAIAAKVADQATKSSK